MSDDLKKSGYVLTGLTIGFVALAAAFVISSRTPVSPKTPVVSVTAPKSSTVRISATQLIKRGGDDASALDCYACHDAKKPVELKFDAEHRLVFPKEHADLIISMRNCETCHGTDKPVKLESAADGSVIMPKAHQDLLAMAHGRNNRNDNCFNCHDPAKLNQLVTREGKHLKFEEATALCASCHGPTFRDWEAGVHGRTTGYWNRAMGPIVREECTSCHDPHAPAFPKIIPLPGPRPLHAPARAKPNPNNHPLS